MAQAINKINQSKLMDATQALSHQDGPDLMNSGH
jgi:hypothetical protein